MRRQFVWQRSHMTPWVWRWLAVCRVEGGTFPFMSPTWILTEWWDKKAPSAKVTRNFKRNPLTSLSITHTYTSFFINTRSLLTHLHQRECRVEVFCANNEQLSGWVFVLWGCHLQRLTIWQAGCRGFGCLMNTLYITDRVIDEHSRLVFHYEVHSSSRQT